MAFPLAPIAGEKYEDIDTGRLWIWDGTVPGWLPNDINVLDELKNVVTVQNTTLGPLGTAAERTALTAPAGNINVDNNGIIMRDVFTLTDNYRLQDITLPLTGNVPALTSGILNIEVYPGSQPLDVTVPGSGLVLPTGGVVLNSGFIEAITAAGNAVFTFPENILQPGSYTFVIRTYNLDDAVTTDIGLGANLLEIIYNIQGQVVSGTTVDGDVLKYDGVVGNQWEAGSGYGSGAFDPLIINNIANPTVADVSNPGVFWRNSLTQRVFISQGAGVWWPIPPDNNTSGPAIAVRSSTAPAGPVDGDLWFHDDTARLYVWDADAVAWIEV